MSWNTLRNIIRNPMTAAGDIIFGSTGGTAARLGKGTTGQVLKQGASAPVWSAESGFANPMSNDGEMIIGGAGGSPEALGAGEDGQVLTAVSGGSIEWRTPSSGGVDIGQIYALNA